MPSPRRLTRDEQRARTRRELLTAARDVFSARGFHAASVDDVAEAAGYTKGAVYSNFSSKEQLFLALFDASVDDTVAAIDEVLRTPPSERFELLGARRSALAFFSPQWQLLEAEFVLYAARNPHVKPQLARRQAQLRRQVADRIRRHLDDTGASTSYDLEDLARLVGAAADGLALQQLAEGDGAADMGALLRDLLTIVFDGAVRRPTSPTS